MKDANDPKPFNPTRKEEKNILRRFLAEKCIWRLRWITKRHKKTKKSLQYESKETESEWSGFQFISVSQCMPREKLYVRICLGPSFGHPTDDNNKRMNTMQSHKFNNRPAVEHDFLYVICTTPQLPMMVTPRRLLALLCIVMEWMENLR